MTLTELRTRVPKSSNDWIDAVLRGETNTEMAARLEISKNAVALRSRMAAEWLDIPVFCGNSIREAVLRLRISELEASDGR